MPLPVNPALPKGGVNISNLITQGVDNGCGSSQTYTQILESFFLQITNTFWGA